MKTLRALHFTVLFMTLLSLAGRLPAQSAPPADSITMKECVVIGSVGRSGRAAVHTDAIEAQIVAGSWSPPKVGDKMSLPDGSAKTWESAEAGADGWVNHRALNGGYAYWSVEVDAPKVMILEAAGHNMAYVNGEPRMGDPYAYGYVRLPVALRAGNNDLLFQCGRGRLQAKLVSPKAPLMLNTGDTTLPDLLAGESEPMWGAVVVVNASNRPAERLTISAMLPNGHSFSTPLPSIPPLSVRKVGFQIGKSVTKSAGTCPVELRLIDRERGGAETMDTARIELRVRAAGATYKRTFISEIDGSVQYYAVNPAPRAPGDKTSRALFLSLHGASVEAIGQADAYESKAWGDLVAPTNRRPYGFDWEDWGRLDALEVLDLAIKRFHPDPRRIYLTGHSMGGHGTWIFGVTYPDRFAAIGPSAGWISFQSYAGGKRYENPNPIQSILARAASGSDTLALAHNTTHYGVYILHGGADDNVPVTEAREMNRILGGFHHDFVYHEQPGVGHWWDLSDEPGADCVDWAPMFDFFARHARPADEDVRQIDFTTTGPGISSQSRWAGIEAQIHAMQPSTISLRCDPGKHRFVGTTENVARLSLSLDAMPPGKPLMVELDGQKIESIPWPSTSKLWLERTENRWTIASSPSPAVKGPNRCGPFKEAFRHRMLFVYGTKGTEAENAWAFAKARYDAEQFWYRGNGAVDILPDAAFQPSAERDRSVILYGNADTNAAWSLLLADSPVQAHRGGVRIGGGRAGATSPAVEGGDLACLFLRPRPGSDRACVGVVAGTGLPGFRMADRLPYFVSGVGYPDCIVLGSDSLTKDVVGVRAAGFFGLDWGVESGEWAWRETR